MSLFFGVNSGTPYLHSNNNTLSFGATGSNTFSATMTLSSGNVGIGVTPFANTIGKSLDLVNGGGMFAASNNFYVTGNAYFDSAWKYKATSGAAFINLNSGGNGNIAFVNAASGTAGNTIAFTEKMIITSGGNVGIGTTAPNTLGFSGPMLTVSGTGQGQGLEIWRNSNTIPDGEDIGLVTFLAGTSPVQVSRIVGKAEGTSENAGGLSFQTTPSGGGPTERLKITSGGGVTIASLGTGLVYSSSGTLTSTNPSDERLKDNIVDISWGLSDILKLRPVSYHWKDDKINQGVQFGFIAQEVQDVMPEAIKEFGDNVKYLGLEKDAIYATLVKAIQELKAEIEQLKQK